MNYNYAALPITDTMHVRKVIETDRRAKRAIRDYFMEKNDYQRKYYRMKKGLI